MSVSDDKSVEEKKPEAEAEDLEAVQAGEVEEAPEQDVEHELRDLRDRLLRAVAETENVRRRAEREKADASAYAVTGFAREMLNVADNLRRALDALPAEMHDDERLKTFVTGVELTERELLAIFERQGIRKIVPEGEKFDHNFHQAMFEVADTGKPAGTVVQVVQPGYVIKDRLLRPAMVGVAKGETKAQADGVDTTA